MAQEGLFWVMLAIVVSAVVIGALAGFAARILHSIAVCVGWAAVACVVVVFMADLAGALELLPIAGIATFLFSTMISCAVALVTQRIRRARRARVENHVRKA